MMSPDAFTARTGMVAIKTARHRRVLAHLVDTNSRTLCGRYVVADLPDSQLPSVSGEPDHCKVCTGVVVAS